MAELSDEDLVRRSQDGDRTAFEESVRRTGRYVHARIYLETGDAHRAEDLTQETFLAAWKGLAGLKTPAGFRAWLTGIASNVVIDAARSDGRKKRRGAGTQVEMPDSLPDGGPLPAEQLQLDQQRQRVLENLRAMPAEYRMPLMLRYLEGADYQTIGRQLGLTNGSLRGLLNRGLALLRQRMGDKS